MTPQPYAMSARQAKAADRVGGIDLMLPWPAHLPEPDLRPDVWMDATPSERAWGEARVVASCREHGLVPVRVKRVVTRRGSGAHAPLGAALAVTIIGQRWVHATGAPRPRVMWAEIEQRFGEIE